MTDLVTMTDRAEIVHAIERPWNVRVMSRAHERMQVARLREERRRVVIVGDLPWSLPAIRSKPLRFDDLIELMRTIRELRERERARTRARPMTIAALYNVNMIDVDAWGESRDARTYRGPHPVVDHPPCAAWSVIKHLAINPDTMCGLCVVEQVRAPTCAVGCV